MTHLSDEQLSAYAAAVEDETTRAHLGECAACHDEAARLMAWVGNAKAAMEDLTPDADAFWMRQRAAVEERLRRRGSQRRAWTVAAAFALLFLISISLWRIDRPAPHPKRIPAAAAVSDDELFAAVNATLQQDVPTALQPAQLLAGGSVPSDSSSSNANPNRREQR